MRTLIALKADPLLQAQNIINSSLSKIKINEQIAMNHLNGQEFVNALRACVKAEQILTHAFDYIEERIENECVVHTTTVQSQDRLNNREKFYLADKELWAVGIQSDLHALMQIVESEPSATYKWITEKYLKNIGKAELIEKLKY